MTAKTKKKPVLLNKPFYVESGPQDFDPDFTTLYRIIKGPLKSATPEQLQKDWADVLKTEISASGHLDLDEAWSVMYEKGWDFEEVTPRLSVCIPGDPWIA